jgi:hypothetical protein
MARSRWVYSGSEVIAEYRNDELVWAKDMSTQTKESAPYITPDLPDKVSTIDGTLISGRAGLREHCKRYDVVPTEDLKGLPPKTMFRPVEHSKREREEIKQFMSHIYDSLGGRP